MRPAALRVACPTCGAAVMAPCLSPSRRPLAWCHVERADLRADETLRERSRARNDRRKRDGKKRINTPTISVSGRAYAEIKAEATARDLPMSAVVEERIARLVNRKEAA